jgi:hypothetical protein
MCKRGVAGKLIRDSPVRVTAGCKRLLAGCRKNGAVKTARRAVPYLESSMWERLLVLRASVIRLAVLLAGRLTLVGTIRPQQQPTKTARTAGASAGVKRGDARRDFWGDGVCQECHQTIAETYLRTNHHLTSQTAQQRIHRGEI